MTKYKTSPFYSESIGSFPSITVSDKPMETKEEELLWHFNKSREHDGLDPVSLEWFRNRYDIVFTPVE